MSTYTNGPRWVTDDGRESWHQDATWFDRREAERQRRRIRRHHKLTRRNDKRS